MLHIVEQTREEKIAMYEKLSKKELIELLLENQRLVEMLSRPQTPIVVNPAQPVTIPYYPSPAYPHPLWPTIVCDTTIS